MRFGVSYERLVGEPRTTGRAGRRPRGRPEACFEASPEASAFAVSPEAAFVPPRTTPSPPLRKLPPRPLRPDRRLTVRPEIFQSRRLRRLPCGRSEERPPPCGGCLPGNLLPGQPHRLCRRPYGPLRGLRYGNRGCSVFRHRCDNSPIIFQRLVRPEHKSPATERSARQRLRRQSAAGRSAIRTRGVQSRNPGPGAAPPNSRSNAPIPRRRREFGVAKRVPHGFDPILSSCFHSSM